jgi:D-sedoheptulose 7-phosphate isomerase
MNLMDLMASRLSGSLTAIASLRARLDVVVRIGECVIHRLENGGTLYTAGNGGSAAEALHLAEELIGRYRGNRRPLRAVCLNADATALTCIANDFGFDQIFARQCAALLTANDVLVVLSTSGTSANIVEVLKVGRSTGAATVGLLGKNGGASLPLCDYSIVIDSSDSAHIQEAHQVVIHMICEAVEARFGSTQSARGS